MERSSYNIQSSMSNTDFYLSIEGILYPIVQSTHTIVLGRGLLSVVRNPVYRKVIMDYLNYMEGVEP